MGALLHGGVPVEAQLGGVPQVEPVGKLPPYKAGGADKALLQIGRVLLFRKGGIEDLCVFQIGGHVHRRNAHKTAANAGILYLPYDLRKLLSHFLTDLSKPRICHNAVLSGCSL